MLNIKERKLLRYVYQPVTEKGISKITTNQEIRQLQPPHLEADIKK
jgi:hypothetical protein